MQAGKLKNISASEPVLVCTILVFKLLRSSLTDWKVEFRVPNRIYFTELRCRTDTLYMTVPLRSANGAESYVRRLKTEITNDRGGTVSAPLFTGGPLPALNDPDLHSRSTTYMARQATQIRFFRSDSGSLLDNLYVMTELRPGSAVVLRTWFHDGRTNS
jgi:hypothetical protein